MAMAGYGLKCGMKVLNSYAVAIIAMEKAMFMKVEQRSLRKMVFWKISKDCL